VSHLLFVQRSVVRDAWVAMDLIDRHVVVAFVVSIFGSCSGFSLWRLKRLTITRGIDGLSFSTQAFRAVACNKACADGMPIRPQKNLARQQNVKKRKKQAYQQRGPRDGSPDTIARMPSNTYAGGSRREKCCIHSGKWKWDKTLPANGDISAGIGQTNHSKAAQISARAHRRQCRAQSRTGRAQAKKERAVGRRRRRKDEKSSLPGQS